jgi:hypothetical protein
MRLSTVLLAAALTFAATAGASAASTYTCPSSIRAQDSSSRAIVTVNLSSQVLSVYYNLFTTAPSGWSATADASFLVPCKVVGQVVDQTSRVLLVCNCVGQLNNSQISGSATYIVSAGSQCTYQGNLQFQCN